jgi:ATP-binding cassette, subfamily B, bacterial
MPSTHARDAEPPVLRWTLSLLVPYRGAVAGLAGLSLAEIALRALTPWPLKAVVDYVAAGYPVPRWLDAWLPPVAADPRVRVLVGVIAAAVVVQVLHQVVLMCHTRLHVRIGQRMVYGLRARLFAHLQSLSLATHDSRPKGDAIYRLEADAGCVEHLLLRGFFPMAFSALTLLVMFSVLATIDATLAIVAVSIAPALYAAMRVQTTRMAARAAHTKALESKVVSTAYESLSTIRLVKGFAREPFELARFTGAAATAMTARMRLVDYEARYSLLISVIGTLGSIAVLAVGGLQVIEGRLTPGTLMLVMAYVGYVYGPMTAIAHTTGAIQQAIASARRVRETLELPSEPFDAPNAIVPGRLQGHVRFDGVSFGYARDRATLTDISFEAHPGQLVALVGPSGAGKTTVVSLLTRFLEPGAGRILIDGIDASRYRLQALREQVGIVLQEGLLISGTLAENIRYGRLDATHEDVVDAARLAGADDFISRAPLGYETEMAEAGAGLSGGERQRLSIARAFLKAAPIVVLDEPTASLDAVSEARVLEAVRTLRSGRTTFVIAHRLSTVRDADLILVLDAGRIVARGTHDELLTSSPLYAGMCTRLGDVRAA